MGMFRGELSAIGPSIINEWAIRHWRLIAGQGDPSDGDVMDVGLLYDWPVEKTPPDHEPSWDVLLLRALACFPRDRLGQAAIRTRLH